MRNWNRWGTLGLTFFFGALAGGCSSGAHAATNRPVTTSPPIYLAQATCWDTVSCCVERNPLTAVESCGADPVQVASILKTLAVLNETVAQSGAKAAADADVAEEEQAEDWSSIADLPQWKQRCIKYYNACQDRGWKGPCHDCLRYCEGQHEWPFRMCTPRKE